MKEFIKISGRKFFFKKIGFFAWKMRKFVEKLATVAQRHMTKNWKIYRYRIPKLKAHDKNWKKQYFFFANFSKFPTDLPSETCINLVFTKNMKKREMWGHMNWGVIHNNDWFECSLSLAFSLLLAVGYTQHQDFRLKRKGEEKGDHWNAFPKFVMRL